MQRFNDLNRWSEGIPVADSSVSRMRMLAFVLAQESLDEVGVSRSPHPGSKMRNPNLSSPLAERKAEAMAASPDANQLAGGRVPSAGQTGYPAGGHRSHHYHARQRRGGAPLTR